MTQASQAPYAPSPVPVIAVTGCDGSGKSTLATSLTARLRRQVRVESVYLGQSSGHINAWIGGLPVIGAPCARYLAGKAARVHDHQHARTGNATATALTIYLLSKWRAHKFRRMLALCRRGTLVITDRYPQAEVPGFHFDGPGLEAGDNAGWLVRKLAASERRSYQWMASHVPALVIRLSVDADTAHARKPDHALAVLREKIATLPQLHFNGARIVDLDGRRPFEENLEAALNAIHAAIDRLQT